MFTSLTTSLFLSGLLTEAHADAITDGPGAMHGNLGLRTTISSATDTLIEAGNVVGARTHNQTKLELYGEFSPIKHVSLAFSVPYLNQEYSFADISAMGFDPETKTGSYLDSSSMEDMTRNGSGMAGATLGIFLYPFHNRLFEERADRGAWKLGVQYRLSSAQHFYTTDEDGNRGVGPGAGAWQFYGSFAMPNKIGQPYTELKATSAGVWEGPVRNDDGVELRTQAQIRPPSSVSLRIGNEITLWEDTAFAHYLELDFYGRATYNSWSDVTTGVLLPNILTSYDDYIVNQSETVQIMGGLATNLQYDSYYHGRVAFEMGMISPQSVEHLYPISTNGTIVWSVLFDVRFRYRTTAT
jgi:hypothetical protein